MKKDLHVCPRCDAAVDYVKDNGHCSAVHAPIAEGQVSVKNLIAKSTERRLRRNLSAICKRKVKVNE